MEKLKCRPCYIKHGSACSNTKAPITQNGSKTDAQVPGHASPINMENTPHQRMTDSITSPIFCVITLATGRFRYRLWCEYELTALKCWMHLREKLHNIHQHDICIYKCIPKWQFSCEKRLAWAEICWVQKWLKIHFFLSLYTMPASMAIFMAREKCLLKMYC